MSRLERDLLLSILRARLRFQRPANDDREPQPQSVVTVRL